MNEYESQVLDALIKIKLRTEDGGGTVYGICSIVEDILYHDRCNKYYSLYRPVLDKLFISWPKFSGCTSYPVPSGSGSVSAVDKYGKGGSKWVGEYGLLRIELLDHMITELGRNL